MHLAIIVQLLLQGDPRVFFASSTPCNLMIDFANIPCRCSDIPFFHSPFIKITLQPHEEFYEKTKTFSSAFYVYICNRTKCFLINQITKVNAVFMLKNKNKQCVVMLF